MEKYPPLSDSLIILRTTTHLSLTVPSSWGKHYPPQLDGSIILESTTYLYLTVPSSLSPLPISNWKFHHAGDYYQRLPDISVIQRATVYLNWTVSSSGGPLPISTWQFHHLGGHYLPVPDWSIILGITHRLYMSVPSSWNHYHVYLTVQSSFVSPLTSTWQFHHIVDHYLPLPDRSIIKGTTTHLFLTVRSLCGPLSTSLRITTHLYIYTWQFHHLGDNYPPLPDSFVIIGTTTHHYPTVPSSWGQLPISA